MSSDGMKVFLSQSPPPPGGRKLLIAVLFLLSAGLAAIWILNSREKAVVENPKMDGIGNNNEVPPPLQPELNVPPAPPKLQIFVSASFDNDEDGFQLVTNCFRGSKTAGYAKGARVSGQGAAGKQPVPLAGGALNVYLGGMDSKTVQNMSGGWRRTWQMEEPATVALSFRYILFQSSEYEGDEFSEALVTVDGAQPELGGKEYLARLTGDGNGGAQPTTGWQTISVNLGQLAPGTHTLTLGAFNSKKTADSEFTAFFVDDVILQTAQPGVTLQPAQLPTPVPASKVDSEF